MIGPALQRGQRRFYLRHDGTVALVGSWFDRDATAEDLSLLSSFGRRVLESVGWWDAPSWHWMANRVLAATAPRAAALAVVLLVLCVSQAAAQAGPRPQAAVCSEGSTDQRCAEAPPGEAATELDDDDAAAPEAAGPSPLVGAVWCAVYNGNPWEPDQEPPADTDEDGEATEPESVEACDAGLGLALWRWRGWRLAPVAVVGSHTVGAGVAWVAHTTAAGHAFAVAAGVVARWDRQHGIHAEDARFAFGATFSFGGGTP